MVRVGLFSAEGLEQAAELVGAVVAKPDREVRPAEGRQQFEACRSELPRPWQVDHSVRGESSEEPFQRRRPDVVEGAEHGDPPQWLAVEHEGVVGSAGMVGEGGQARGTAPNDDDAVVRDLLVAEMRPELLPIAGAAHVPGRLGITKSATSSAASSWSVGDTWL